MRKLVGALGTALEHLQSDPGARPASIKTGSVVIAPATAAVPASRKQQVGPNLEARWTPIAANLEHLSLNELAKVTANGQVPVAGWEVTYHKIRKGVDFESMSGEELRAHVLSLSIAPEDDALYNGYYATIKGNDVAHHDPNASGMAAFQGGRVLRGNATATHDGTIRGGTEIRGGRAEYKRKTKGYEAMDAGYWAHVDRIKAEKAAERQRKTDLELAQIDAKLPRKIGEL